MTSEKKRNIVIIGGGIIGCTTAYFLTRHKTFDPALHKITILEATEVAAGASGKAGGLLALWAYPECLVPLSFDLHAKLAIEHDGANKWGYRKLKCGSISATVTSEMLSRTSCKRKRDQEAPETDAGAKGGGEAKLPIKPALEGNGTTEQANPTVVSQTTADASESTLESTSAAPTTTTSAEVAEEEHKLAEGSEPKMPVTKDADKPEEAADPSSPEKAPEAAPEVQSKDWEKLPKQDDAAAALLEESPLPNDLTWIDPATVEGYAEMGGPKTADTAQVHPFHFTTSIARLAQEAGVEIKTRTRVTNVLASKTTIEGVEYLDRQTNETHTIRDMTDVVVCAGPWTGKLIPRAKVEGLRAHSVVWEAEVSPYAVFTDIDLPADYVPEHRVKKGQKKRHRGRVDPEIYARPFGEVYACGEPDSTVPLPETADLVQSDPTQCEDLIAYTSTISSQLRNAPVKTRQSCYLPRHMRFGEERGPLIGPTSVAGLWVASGHTCWGIQNGPATGFLMAEYLLEGSAKGAKVDKLDPRKFKV